ncbi:MAG: ABC transporter substrate-binding protein [bacterium]|nr:ABC transporter substrate-binding protein [bacterium]
MSRWNRRTLGAAALCLLFLLAGCEALRGPLRTTPTRADKPETSPGDIAPPSSRDSAITRSERDETGAGLVLMLGFSWMDDSAAVGFERAFRFALNRSQYVGRFDVVRPGSPFETLSLCDSLAMTGGPLLAIFAGDEGSAAAAAMRAAEQGIPLLKITADQRSYTEIGDRVFEFLPSGQKQAEVLGRFAALDLGLAVGMILTPQDAKGRAHAAGFAKGTTQAGGRIEAERFYPAFAANVRNEIAELLGNEQRKARGALPLTGALTEEEREQMFGDPLGGEMLLGGRDADSLMPSGSVGSEGLYFVVAPERVETFASQLTRLPEGTILLGNSSWLNENALARYPSLTEGMYLTAPLLQHGDETAPLLAIYQESNGSLADAWELLGLDAGDFVSQVMNRSPRSRQDVVHQLSSMPPFAGAAVTVDFSEGKENRAARILQFEAGEFRVVR